MDQMFLDFHGNKKKTQNETRCYQYCFPNLPGIGNTYPGKTDSIIAEDP